MKYIFLLFIFLSACNHTPPTVDVIVPVKSPTINSPEKSTLAIENINAKTPSPEVVKSYLMSLGTCIAYAKQEEELLKPFGGDIVSTSKP